MKQHALGRTNSPSRTQLIQDELIKKGHAIRYIIKTLKDDGTVEHVDEGPFPGKDPKWQEADPSNGRQKTIAALKKRDSEGNLASIIVAAHVADGVGGIKVVTGRDIPPVWDKGQAQHMQIAKKDDEWLAAHDNHLAQRAAAADRGKVAVKQAVDQIATEKVAVAEKASGKASGKSAAAALVGE